MPLRRMGHLERQEMLPRALADKGGGKGRRISLISARLRFKTTIEFCNHSYYLSLKGVLCVLSCRLSCSGEVLCREAIEPHFPYRVV